jgi:hypothetical protein
MSAIQLRGSSNVLHRAQPICVHPRKITHRACGAILRRGTHQPEGFIIVHGCVDTIEVTDTEHTLSDVLPSSALWRNSSMFIQPACSVCRFAAKQSRTCLSEDASHQGPLWLPLPFGCSTACYHERNESRSRMLAGGWRPQRDSRKGGVTIRRDCGLGPQTLRGSVARCVLGFDSNATGCTSKCPWQRGRFRRYESRSSSSGSGSAIAASFRFGLRGTGKRVPAAQSSSSMSRDSSKVRISSSRRRSSSL